MFEELYANREHAGQSEVIVGTTCTPEQFIKTLLLTQLRVTD